MNQKRRRVTVCPLCDAPLQVTELTCTGCLTRLQGTFQPPPLARLAPEHQAFIETFVRCRGVIRDVERALGISYPTVRAKLDTVVAALEAVQKAETIPQEQEKQPEKPLLAQKIALRRNLLQQVEDGNLSPEEAADLLSRV